MREARVTVAGAAVLLGDVQPQQALLAQLEPHLTAEAVVGRVFFLVGTELAVDERPAALAERVVVLVENRTLHHALDQLVTRR